MYKQSNVQQDWIVKDLKENPDKVAANFYVQKDGWIEAKYIQGNNPRKKYTNKIIITSLHLTFRYDDVNEILNTLRLYPNNSTSLPSYDEMVKWNWLGSDSFTNSIFINYILQQNNNNLLKLVDVNIKSEKEINNYGNLFATYGYKQYEDFGCYLSNLISNREIKPYTTLLKVDSIFLPSDDYESGDENFSVRVFNYEFIQGVVSQIVCCLNNLEDKYRFRHGYPSPENIVFINKGNNTFICKLTNLENSSLVYNSDLGPVRLYNRVTFCDLYLTGPLFNIKIYTDGVEEWYVLDDKFTLNAYKRLIYSGLPFYKGFDIYIFIICLLMKPEIFFAINCDINLRNKIWGSLWYNDNYEGYELIKKEAQRLLVGNSASTLNKTSKEEVIDNSINIALQVLRNNKLKTSVAKCLLNNIS